MLSLICRGGHLLVRYRAARQHAQVHPAREGQRWEFNLGSPAQTHTLNHCFLHKDTSSAVSILGAYLLHVLPGYRLPLKWSLSLACSSIQCSFRSQHPEDRSKSFRNTDRRKHFFSCCSAEIFRLGLEAAIHFLRGQRFIRAKTSQF